MTEQSRAPVPTAIPGPGAGYPGAGGPGSRRRAVLVIERLNPLTVLRVSFVLSAVLGILAVLAIVLLWILLDSTGSLDQLGTMFGTVFGPGPGLHSDLRQYLPLAQATLGATLMTVLNVVLVSGCAAIGAGLYNTAARVLSGAVVTFTDDLPERSPWENKPWRRTE